MTGRILLSLLLLTVAGGALAAPKKDAKAKPPAPPIEVAEVGSVPAYTFYDRVIDPMTAAIRLELAEAGRNGSFLDKRDGAAVAEHYAEQGYAPSWVTAGKLSEKAKKIIARIAASDADGLDPAAYVTPTRSLGEFAPVSVTDLARADVQLSLAIVTYARHAYAGRLEPGSVSPNFGYQPHLPGLGRRPRRSCRRGRSGRRCSTPTIRSIPNLSASAKSSRSFGRPRLLKRRRWCPPGPR